MAENNNMIIIFALCLFGIAYYIFYCRRAKEHYTETEGMHTKEYNDDSNNDTSNLLSIEPEDETINDYTSNDNSDESINIIRSRAKGQNGNYNKQYKHSSYRSTNNMVNNEVSKQFKVPDITENNIDNYVPNEEHEQNERINIKNIKGTDKDKYDVNAFLPQEKDKDWFETIDTVDVKNSHLINIYRPIGCNTIGSSLKNATYDIRGTDTAVCPKFAVSPWSQSSIEPDRSSKSLCT